MSINAGTCVYAYIHRHKTHRHTHAMYAPLDGHGASVLGALHRRDGGLDGHVLLWYGGLWCLFVLRLGMVRISISIAARWFVVFVCVGVGDYGAHFDFVRGGGSGSGHAMPFTLPRHTHIYKHITYTNLDGGCRVKVDRVPVGLRVEVLVVTLLPEAVRLPVCGVFCVGCVQMWEGGCVCERERVLVVLCMFTVLCVGCMAYERGC